MRWIAIMAVTGALAGCAGEDLGAVQADPAKVTPAGSSNWALGAPREITTAATPTHEVAVFATGPEELLGYLDGVAMAEDRVEAIDAVWPAKGPTRAYVQRSATFGFPDVISVEAVDLGVGDAGQRSSLVIYSQAIYGSSDLGVNGERIERWLAKLSAAAPVVSGRGTGG